MPKNPFTGIGTFPLDPAPIVYTLAPKDFAAEAAVSGSTAPAVLAPSAAAKSAGGTVLDAGFSPTGLTVRFQVFCLEAFREVIAFITLRKRSIIESS